MLEPDDGDGLLGWTLAVDLLMALVVGALFRRVPRGQRWAVAAVLAGTVVGLVAAVSLVASWAPVPDDSGGLLALSYGIHFLIHLVLAAPMAALAAAVVRRSQRRFPLEPAGTEPAVA